MTKLEAVNDIRKALQEFLLIRGRIADDYEAAQAFQGSYNKLVERFYKETHEMLAYQQYQAAKDDPEYFAQLVLLACRHYEGEGKGPEALH